MREGEKRGTHGIELRQLNNSYLNQLQHARAMQSNLLVDINILTGRYIAYGMNGAGWGDGALPVIGPLGVSWGPVWVPGLNPLSPLPARETFPSDTATPLYHIPLIFILLSYWASS